MTVSKTQVLEVLRRVKGPNLEGNIVELGLVSEVLVKDGRVYFSVTVPANKAEELEPLRQAAQKVVEEIEGVSGATAVLTAEAARGTAGQVPGSDRQASQPRVRGCGESCLCPGQVPQPADRGKKANDDHRKIQPPLVPTCFHFGLKINQVRGGSI